MTDTQNKRLVVKILGHYAEVFYGVGYTDEDWRIWTSLGISMFSLDSRQLRIGKSELVRLIHARIQELLDTSVAWELAELDQLRSMLEMLPMLRWPTAAEITAIEIGEEAINVFLWRTGGPSWRWVSAIGRN